MDVASDDGEGRPRPGEGVYDPGVEVDAEGAGEVGRIVEVGRKLPRSDVDTNLGVRRWRCAVCPMPRGG